MGRRNYTFPPVPSLSGISQEATLLPVETSHGHISQSPCRYLRNAVLTPSFQAGTVIIPTLQETEPRVGGTHDSSLQMPARVHLTPPPQPSSYFWTYFSVCTFPPKYFPTRITNKMPVP